MTVPNGVSGDTSRNTVDGPRTRVGPAPYSRICYRILKNAAAIQALSPAIAQFSRQTQQADDITLTPEYFLERNEFLYAPLLVLILDGEKIAAVLYGKERRVLGIRTGMVQFGDYCGDGAVISEKHFRGTAIAWGALRALELPGIHSVCASFKPMDQNEVTRIGSICREAEAKTWRLEETVQHILPLKNSFDAFLKTLGSHTRRNLRVYRRRVEQKGWRYTARLEPAEVAAAFAALERCQKRHKSSPRDLSCCRAALQAVPGSFCSGLSTASGEWVSLAAGWTRNEKYFMLVQLNDERDSRGSISTVMRSYLIESLIGAGIQTINFVGGCSELLGQFCTQQACAHYLFEKSGPLSTVRRLVAPLLFGDSKVSRIDREGQRVFA